MSDIVMKTAEMLDMLPDTDKSFAYEFVKKLVLAWDPDFTKVTPEEAKSIENAENSGYLNEDEIDWDNLAGI